MTRSGRPGAVRIAVDLLGGDEAPAAVVDGALLAVGADPHLYLHLVGPPEVADQVITGCPASARGRLSTAPAPAQVAMSDAPARGARTETTVRAAVAAVADGFCHAVVSAGASGATVTAAVLGLGRAAGIRRPALAAMLPARSGPVVLLDVGASVEATPAQLAVHAVLGAGYAALLGLAAAPRVGLLTIGAEDGKGDRVRRAADGALRAIRLPGAARYVGNVEGHDVTRGGRADVVVTDGFTGNVLLKGIEGAFELAGGEVSAEAVPRAAALLGMAAGTVIVCHGAASGADVASGIALAARLVRLASPAAELIEVHP